MKRRLRKFLRDERAITPVLSNLLLTVVAVAAMALATSATYVISTNLRENMSERVIAEDVWFDDSTNNINVYVHNIGKVAIHVSGVYINNTSQSFTNPFNLEVGAHKWLNISRSWVSGGLYKIGIVTNRGTHVEGFYEAP